MYAYGFALVYGHGQKPGTGTRRCTGGWLCLKNSRWNRGAGPPLTALQSGAPPAPPDRRPPPPPPPGPRRPPPPAPPPPPCLWAEVDTDEPAEKRHIALIGTAYLVLVHHVRKGRNWARVTVLVLVALGVIESLVARRALEIIPFLLNLLEVLLDITALALLFSNPASQWFNRPRH